MTLLARIALFILGTVLLATGARSLYTLITGGKHTFSEAVKEGRLDFMRNAIGSCAENRDLYDQLFLEEGTDVAEAAIAGMMYKALDDSAHVRLLMRGIDREQLVDAAVWVTAGNNIDDVDFDGMLLAVS